MNSRMLIFFQENSLKRATHLLVKFFYIPKKNIMLNLIHCMIFQKTEILFIINGIFPIHLHICMRWIVDLLKEIVSCYDSGRYWYVFYFYCTMQWCIQSEASKSLYSKYHCCPFLIFFLTKIPDLEVWHISKLIEIIRIACGFRRIYGDEFFLSGNINWCFNVQNIP